MRRTFTRPDRARCRRPVVVSPVVLPALLVAIVVLVVAPGALAKSFSISDCTISSTIARNGDLTATVRQTFDFDGSFTRVYWTLPKKGTRGIDVLGVNGPGGPLQQTEAPGRPPGAYRVTDEGSEVLVEAYFALSDTAASFVLEYRALGAATRWSDTSELDWQFIGPVWAVPMDRVRVTVAPPAGVAKGDVRAWAHGPLWGNVAILPDATVVAAVAPLPATTMVEVRMVFPAAALGAAAAQPEAMLPTILSQEKAAAEQANAARQAARDAEHRTRVLHTIGGIIGLVLAAGGVVFYVVMYRRYGREYTPALPGEYYRDIPADLPPATVQYLWKTESIDDKAIPATLLDLANRGIVRIDQVSEEERGLFHSKQTTSYRLTLDPSKAHDLDASAREIIAMLFTGVGDGASFVVSDLRDYAKDHRKEFAQAHGDWKKAATEAAEARGFFDSSATAASRVVAGVGLFLVVAPLLTAFVTGAWLMLAPVPVGIGLLIGTRAIKRRTAEANELYAKYHGLYRYMKDFGRLQEKPPTAVVLWEQYLVLATLFGIADQVIRDMHVAVPEVVNDPGFRSTYWWIAAPTVGQDLFTTAFSQDMTAAIAASTASSAGGAGGGFSGGGGFGGGGMGGGAD